MCRSFYKRSTEDTYVCVSYVNEIYTRHVRICVWYQDLQRMTVKRDLETCTRDLQTNKRHVCTCVICKRMYNRHVRICVVSGLAQRTTVKRDMQMYKRDL